MIGIMGGSQEDVTRRGNGILLIVGAASLFFLQSVSNGLLAALPGLSEAFPQYSVDQVSMLTSLVMVASIPTNIFCQAIIGRIGFKQTLFVAFALYFIGGLTPFFVRDNFALIMVCRVVVGLAFGLFLPMAPTYAGAKFGESTRAKLLGWGGTLSGLSGMIHTQVGGILANGDVWNVFLYHLLVLPVLVLALFIPNLQRKAARQLSQEDSAQESLEGKERGRIPALGWFVIVFAALSFFFIYPTLIYVSSIVVNTGMGDAATAGTVTATFSLAGLLVGPTFGVFYKKLGLHTMTLSFAIAMAGMFCIGFGASIPLLIAGSMLVGFGYTTIVTMAPMIYSIVCPGQLTFAVGLTNAASSALSFVSPFVYTFLSGFAGMEGDLRFSFYCGGTLLLASAVVIAIVLRRVGPSFGKGDGASADGAS